MKQVLLSLTFLTLIVPSVLASKETTAHFCTKQGDSIINHSQTLENDTLYFQAELLKARKLGNQHLIACLTKQLEISSTSLKRFDYMLTRIFATFFFDRELCYQQLLSASNYIEEELSSESNEDINLAKLKLLHLKGQLKSKEINYAESIDLYNQVLDRIQLGNYPTFTIKVLMSKVISSRLLEASKPFELRDIQPCLADLDSARQLALQYDTTMLNTINYYKGLAIMLVPRVDYPNKYEDAASLVTRSYQIYRKEDNIYMAHSCLNGLLEIISRSQKENVRTQIFNEGGFTNLQGLIDESMALAQKINLDQTYYNTYFNAHTAYWSVKDFEKAVKVVPSMLNYNQRVWNDKQARAQQEYEAKFKSIEKEAKINLLNSQAKSQKKATIMYVVFALLLASVLGFLWFESRRKNKIITQQNLELVELDKQKNKLFANLSHELRTPLTLVRGPLQQLHTGKSLTTKDQNLVGLGLKNTIKLEERVNEILDLAKLDKGKLELKTSSTLLVSFINRLVYSFESNANQENISVNLSTAVAMDEKLALDRTKIEKVVNNLMSNALKHTLKGGSIDVKLAKKEDVYSLIVADSGPGIAKNELERIFDRFYQTKSGKARGGTGIGLALSKQLAQLMSGDITASNESAGGATFEFTFKASKSEDSESPYSEDLNYEPELGTSVPHIEFGKRPNILIVEDNNDMRKYISNILQNKFVVNEAINGNDAWRVLENQSIDLIISDLMMPEKDGFELLQEVKSHPNYKSIPMILLTARGNESDKVFAFENGVDDYIVKPFLHRELIARASTLLKNLEVRKESQGDETALIAADEKSLERIKTTIKENITRKYSVDELAEDVHMSERSLYRLLRSKVGVSPAAYIKELKLAYSYELLMTKKYTTVKEVSYAVGFGRPDYFASEFGKRYGRNPSSYL